ncbi:MAG TPA: hypothetical protein VKZ97_05755 [Flavobacteriaceae bacterium]|nr:hypothetical protein [Flavobacteriaceae bacterium]
METKTMNGSKPQAAEELIKKVQELPEKLLAKHQIKTAKTQQAEPKYKRGRTAGHNESGMALNVTHGIQVVDYLLTYGEAYNPGYAHIAIARLQALNEEAQALLNLSNEKRQFKKVEVGVRQSLFKALKPLVTRIVNEMEACGAPKATVKNARHYVNKIRGTRIIKLDTDAVENSISPRQTSFTEKVQHFTNLINVVKGCEAYAPTVSVLTVASLEAMRDAMASSNNTVSSKQAVWSTSRVERNQFFNAPVTGYVDTYLAVKRAVRAIFGANSPEYYQMSKLAFKRIGA